MHHFAYRRGVSHQNVLHAEEVDLVDLAAAIGTPFYCYSSATLERHFRVFEAAVPKGALIAYAVKANGNLSVIKTLAALGAGADIVSAGELKRALAGGVPASKIVERPYRREDRERVRDICWSVAPAGSKTLLRSAMTFANPKSRILA